MAKYDQEDLLDSVLAIMVDGGALNAKIAAIEAEKVAKSKGVVGGLKAIPSNGYYRQTWTDKILQTSPAIFYGIEDVTTNRNGPVVAKTYKVFVEIVMTDSGQTNDASSRIARYARALEELFCAAYKEAVEFGALEVDQVRPFSFKLELDSDDEIKVGGVSLTIPLV